MEMLRMKFNNKILYIITIVSSILLFVFIVIYLVNTIGSENNSEIGRAEIFVKGIMSPQGLVLDKEGKLFVQNDLDGKISIINKDGVAMDYSYIEDYYGYGIDLDDLNNFIIATQQQIVVLDSSGNALRIISGFKHAYDVAKGPSNSIFVSDSNTNIIYSISPNNEVTVFAELGNKKSSILPNAAGLSFDKDFKNLYVANMYSGDLYKINLSKEYKAEEIEIIASNLQRPNFIDVDDNGNVFITCVGDNTIVRVNKNSIKELIDTKGKLSNPSGIVINNSNSKVLYVGSKDNNSIYKINIETNNQVKK